MGCTLRPGAVVARVANKPAPIDRLHPHQPASRCLDGEDMEGQSRAQFVVLRIHQKHLRAYPRHTLAVSRIANPISGSRDIRNEMVVRGSLNCCTSKDLQAGASNY